jgi:hypothetical protein
MQLDTINTLYLELSQVATATTAKELALAKERDELQRQLDEVDAMIWPSGKPVSYEPNRLVALRAMFRLRQAEGKREPQD